ncbi:MULTISPECIES: LexA family protein [Pseudomonadaceae]|uniref:LexA family protein n=1 Tax=Pseudomonadaceae TaxID=135621 RepID=UPI0021ADEE70|nr:MULTISPECIES: S24 family peptidase [Pseudomonas aeruginosa group]MDH2201642.1 hypothetical protein [Pseudomonas oleovorans]
MVHCGGDSMSGVGIFCGDLLIVNRSKQPISGDIVIAAVKVEPPLERLVMEGTQERFCPPPKTYTV